MRLGVLERVWRRLIIEASEDSYKQDARILESVLFLWSLFAISCYR
jgi:hypothetical protein